jgi:hypothetical protein
LIPADMLRHVEFLLHNSGYRYLGSPEERKESICLMCPSSLSSEGVALTATLPILLREVNDQCRVVVRFEHSLQPHHRTNLHPSDVLNWVHLSQAMKLLLNRGPKAEVHFAGLHLYPDPAATVPCKVFDQPVQEWAMVSSCITHRFFPTHLLT